MNDINLEMNESQNMDNLTTNKYNKYLKMSHVSFSLIKLINSQFLKTKNELFFIFVFSVLFIAIFGFTTAAQFKFEALPFMSTISGIFLLQITQCGMQSMPTAIMEFKTSVLLKRIGATPIKPWMFILSTAIYYFIITIIQILWLLMWLAIMFSFTNFQITSSSVTEQVSGWNLIFGNKSTVQWGGYIFSLLYSSVLGIFIGLFIASISKTAQTSQIMGMMFFFVNMFLAGLLLPISAINSIEPLKIISYIAPFRYVSGLSSTAWAAQGNIFTPWVLSHISATDLKFGVYDNWLNLFMPVVFISVSIGLSIKFFRWNNR